jgi:uncharacterized repeat protein (TIGR01451 family)
VDSIVVTNPPPFLVLTKSVSKTNANAGDTVTFTLSLSNAGGGTATGVVLNDWFPDGLDYAGTLSGPIPNTTNSKAISWQLPALAPGGNQTLVVQSTARMPGTWTNMAQVQFSTNPPVMASASILVLSNSVVITNLVNLSLSKVSSTSEAGVGDPIAFFISVTNNGAWPATNVIVRDLLPPGFQFVNAVDGAGPAVFDSVSGKWTLGFVAPGEIRTLTLNTVAALVGPWTNEADIVYPPNLDPNSVPHGAAFVNLMAPAKADLVIDKFVDSSPVGVQQPLTFIIRVGNQGPSDSKDIIVKDTLPAGVTFNDAKAPDGTSFDKMKMEWTIPKLAAGAFLDLQVITT